MPCILPSGELNGISVPAICARHGGQWIDEPSLLTEPGIGNTMPPSMEYPGLIEPGVGNTFGPIGKSYSGGALQDPSKVMNAIGRDTDDFGNPLNANFAGDTNFGLLRDRAVNKFNTKPFNKPFLGPVTRTNTSQPRMTQTASGLRPMSVRESSKEDRYNVGQKFKSIFGMDDESVARDKASKKGSGLIGTSYSGGPTQAIWHKNQEAKTTDNTTTDNAKTTDNATAVNNGTPTPEAIKGMAKSGEMSEGLLSKMGTKDYWMTGIEGGSGAWDNKLFRLGEMMAYMGTPLSKRGDSPAKRWTSANTEQSKIKAAIEKERIKADAKAKEDADKSTNIYGKFSGPQLARTFLNDVKKQSNRIFTVGDDRDEAQMQSVADSAARRFLVLQESKDATIKQMSDAQKRKMALDEALLGL